jgi:hypothetical protein
MKHMGNLIFFTIIFLAIIAFVFLIINNPEKEVIVTGNGNPGKIMIYTFDGKSYKRSEIDTGYNLVWTVKVGDIYNRGKNVIVAGVGNSFFAKPYGCSVVAYEPTPNGWKKDVIDSNVNIRCKDIEIGDMYNDGKNGIILGTHGEGLIKIYKWTGTKWDSQIIDDNYVARFDSQTGMNHRIPLKNLTYDTVDQTAIHIVEIGDVDNDGKNEIIATISTPNEYEGNEPEIGFVRIYKWDGNKWIATDIDTIYGVIFRAGIQVDDLKGIGKNQLYVTSAPHLLLEYDLKDGKWIRSVIENQTVGTEIDMKAMDVCYIGVKKNLIIATGSPNAVIYSYKWNDKEFDKNLIVNVSDVLSENNIFGLGDNSMSIESVNFNNEHNIVVAGESDTSWANSFVKTSNPFGWEITPYGFLVVSKYDEGKWNSEILDRYSVLGMTVGKLNIEII